MITSVSAVTQKVSCSGGREAGRLRVLPNEVVCASFDCKDFVSIFFSQQ